MCLVLAAWNHDKLGTGVECDELEASMVNLSLKRLKRELELSLSHKACSMFSSAEKQNKDEFCKWTKFLTSASAFPSLIWLFHWPHIPGNVCLVTTCSHFYFEKHFELRESHIEKLWIKTFLAFKMPHLSTSFSVILGIFKCLTEFIFPF